MNTFDPAHRQSEAQVRFGWGPVGALATLADVAVVVDVLSFSTTVDVAVSRGIEVLPFAWQDDRAAAHAAAHDAVLAVGRLEARASGLVDAVSLSPDRMLEARGVDRVVLPSPNGSTICALLADGGAEVVAGCLRNAAAVAHHVASRGGTVTVVAAGERWPDGSLRPADEDLWGAGAILSALVEAGVEGISIEARIAIAAYDAVRGDLPAALHACASGRELVAKGFGADVDVAAVGGASQSVPVLVGDRFRDAATGPMTGPATGGAR